MTMIVKKSIFLSLLLFAGTGVATAQFAEDVLRFSMFNVAVGARAQAMGNTSIGLADDFSALFSNPAGLAQSRNYEFSIGLNQSNYSNDVAFLGRSSDSKLNVLSLNNLGLVYPIPTVRGSLTFAFGFGRVANYSTTAAFNGFNARSSIIEALTPYIDIRSMSASERSRLLEENIPFQTYLADTAGGFLFPVVYDSVQQTGAVREGGGMNSWSLGGAIDIARNFSLGATINILSGSYTYDREFTELDSRNVYTNQNRYDAFHRFDYFSNIKSDITGFNALFGVMFQRQGRFKLGATLRTPTFYDISERFSDEGQSEFDPNSQGVVDRFSKTNSGSTRYEVRTPAVLGAGASLRVMDWLVLAGDAEYTDWTQMEFTNDNPDLIAENRLIKRVFEPTTNLRGGAEVTLWNLGLKLRAGFVLNPSPYKDDPSDYDQKYYTGGIGLEVDENVSLDAAFAFGQWTTFRDNYYMQGIPQASRTSEAVKTGTVNVTLSYRF
jgi:long-subunit fatty acid transport protein